VGPFPEAAGRVKFLILAIDCFTKWVEAEPVASITALQVKKFLWKNIVCRYGIPLVLISDNDTQFADTKIQEWCEELGIQQVFTSVAHPQGNRQVEWANKSIVEGIKARLGKQGHGWIDELPHVLWAHRTMHKSSNGETPYSLTYGSEALIPAEIEIPSHRKTSTESVDND
jgi:transposase InsO family protein